MRSSSLADMQPLLDERESSPPLCARFDTVGATGATDMGTARQKYFYNYDLRKLWCPDKMKLQLPLAYPHCEPELAIARDWHAYR